MLLSDRDIRKQIAEGRVVLEPYDEAMVQPSSVDVRLDRYFRLFDNHKYPVIDPAQEQPDLTRFVEVDPDEPLMLHPGEFILGSTYEVVSLPEDLAARLEGKALAISTWIPTPHGWRTMGDLRPGDEVFDEQGQVCTVLAATEVMEGRPCREVEFSDHTTIVADADHLWFTRSKAEHHRRVAGSIKRTDDIAATLRCGREYSHKVPLAGVVQYPERLLPVDPYVLGYWLGDGTSTSAEITVGPQDEEHVLAQVRAAGYAVWRSARRSAWRIDSLGRALASMGLFGDKRVPAIYLVASPAQRLSVLQGLMDSDGYVDVYGRCEFVSTKEILADGVVELAASLGLRPVKRKKRAMLNGVDCGPAYQVKFTPRLPVFRLERKLARLKTDARAHSHRSIRAVREVPSVPVRCIQVSSRSGMFLAGESFIPTHNSSLGRLGLLTHSTAGFIDPGFSGHVTLELSNVATLPITLWPGMKIGQLCFFQLSSAAEHPYGSDRYGSRYQGQRGPTASRSFQNFHRTQV